MTRGMQAGRQTTLREQVAVSGIGVHSGWPATVTLHPAEADTGIVFVRCGAGGETDRELPRQLPFGDGHRIRHRARRQIRPGRVDHRARAGGACTALGVDNAVVEVDGPEVPIMDGSAAPLSSRRSTRPASSTLSAPRRYIKVLKPVRVARTAAHGELRPHPRGLRVETEIDFDHPLIGRQTFALDVEPRAFRRELARARTFGFMRDVAKLWSAGYALGASLREHGRRSPKTACSMPRACVSPTSSCATRRSMRIGDLALAGAPLIGAYHSVRGGHKLNHAVVTALMADPTAWTYVGAGRAVRRPRGHAELGAGFARAGLRPRDLLICLTFSRLNPGRLSA